MKLQHEKAYHDRGKTKKGMRECSARVWNRSNKGRVDAEEWQTRRQRAMKKGMRECSAGVWNRSNKGRVDAEEWQTRRQRAMYVKT